MELFLVSLIIFLFTHLSEYERKAILTFYFRNPNGSHWYGKYLVLKDTKMAMEVLASSTKSRKKRLSFWLPFIMNIPKGIFCWVYESIWLPWAVTNATVKHMLWGILSSDEDKMQLNHVALLPSVGSVWKSAAGSPTLWSATRQHLFIKYMKNLTRSRNISFLLALEP